MGHCTKPLPGTLTGHRGEVDRENARAASFVVFASWLQALARLAVRNIQHLLFTGQAMLMSLLHPCSQLFYFLSKHCGKDITCQFTRESETFRATFTESVS